MIINKDSSRRNTTQRLKILAHLRKTRTHPTAEEIYAAVKKELPAITLATVYRNLNILTQQGLITKINIDGTCRYEGQEESHVHGIDEKTGTIIDIHDQGITAHARKKLKEQGYDAHNVTIIFTGVSKTPR